MNFNTTVFVPNGDNRRETAILLVGTAREFGIDQRSIRTASGGFYITEDLADVLYDESEQDEPEPAPEDKGTTKTSGNRAAKKNSEEKNA